MDWPLIVSTTLVAFGLFCLIRLTPSTEEIRARALAYAKARDTHLRIVVREEVAAIRSEEAAAQRKHLDADMQAMKERAK